MRLPSGDLLRSRVVDDPGDVLRQALDRRLTGYLVLEPQDSLLLDGETRGIITLEAGVPALAYELSRDRGGADALADLATPGPYHTELYELPAASLSDIDSPSFRVGPDVPAERLAGDADLAARTREAAPAERLDAEMDDDPVAAFLADEEKIDAIRRQAREEAQARAEQWGLDGALDAEPAAAGPDESGP